MSSFVYFTDDQLHQARNANIVDLLHRQGETVKRSGTEYQWGEGSNKVTIRGNQWFHQYDRDGGDPIKFVRRFYNMSFPDAVQFLLGSNCGVIAQQPEQQRRPREEKKFELPARNDNMRRVYAYLLHQRKLERSVVDTFAHIGLVLGSNQDEDTTLSLEFRKAEIEAAVKEMFQQVSVANADMFDESRLAELLSEKADIERQLLQQRERQEVNRNSQSRLETIFTVLDGLQNHPITYDDQIVRQLLQCVLVESKNSIRVVFAGGYEVVQALNQ